ncbi:MAG: diguanylate cyclase [Candidatus Eremiobacteraeota bacterium]|nr:diguanylate cyclase [Candidatus Eremiobacteraeota bacterium]
MNLSLPAWQIANAGFAGYFVAMTAVSTIIGIIMRSTVSLAYALLMLVVALIEFFSLTHGAVGGHPVHSLLISAYLTCLTLFALTLLQTMQHDRNLGWVAIAMTAANVPLIAVEDASVFWREHAFVVDHIALLALLGVLIAIGVRALEREGPAIAGTYLAALAGPAIGLIVDDLATNHVLPHADILIMSFVFGVTWESLFFAYAVALRNRGVQVERDNFERLAYLDGLTGVANRRTFDETLDRMWNVCRRAKVPVAIAMVDIDHFKRLNDTRGHQVGDECLRRVAAVCSSVLRRAGDCFARYGGEEFAAILVNVDLMHAKSLAEQMRRAVERDGGITVSIGLAARVPNDSDSPHLLIAEADAALYRAKHEGRNCVRFSAEEPVTQ